MSDLTITDEQVFLKGNVYSKSELEAQTKRFTKSIWQHSIDLTEFSNLSSLIEYLTQLQVKYPSSQYDMSETYLNLYIQKLESDSEYYLRAISEKIEKKKREDSEYQIYLQLKKKFEKP